MLSSQLKDFGIVWIGSSPFTSDFNLIKKAIKAGADSVQLCSAIYWGGFRAVKKISDELKKRFG